MPRGTPRLRDGGTSSCRSRADAFTARARCDVYGRGVRAAPRMGPLAVRRCGGPRDRRGSRAAGALSSPSRALRQRVERTGCSMPAASAREGRTSRGARCDGGNDAHRVAGREHATPTFLLLPDRNAARDDSPPVTAVRLPLSSAVAGRRSCPSLHEQRRRRRPHGAQPTRQRRAGALLIELSRNPTLRTVEPARLDRAPTPQKLELRPRIDDESASRRAHSARNG